MVTHTHMCLFHKHTKPAIGSNTCTTHKFLPNEMITKEAISIPHHRLPLTFPHPSLGWEGVPRQHTQQGRLCVYMTRSVPPSSAWCQHHHRPAACSALLYITIMCHVQWISHLRCGVSTWLCQSLSHALAHRQLTPTVR